MGTIYKLNFSNGEYYIGQTSKSVNARVTQHKASKGKGCPLLEFAFDNHQLVSYDVLEDNVPQEFLDAKEIYWIEQLKPKLNTTPGGRSTAGLNSPNLKYTKKQIEDVVHLFLETNTPYNEISEVTGVKYEMVHDITKRRAHAWVWENLDPKLFEAAINLRRPSQHRLYDIDNKEYTANTIQQLADQLLEPVHAVHSALQGKKSSRGLSILPHPRVLLTDPQGEQFELTLPRAKEFLQTFPELSNFQITQLVTKYRASGGWQVKLL